MTINTEILLSVKGIKKKYMLKKQETEKDFYALDDISFELKHGESIGLIGKNGSGKSTLLKLISGLVKPSSGTIRINGKTNALIEVGSNFVPDLTGRDNVKEFLRLNHVPSLEIKDKIEQIFVFSDIGGYFDQPVKHYSAGMFVRLAIAAGFHVKADLFIVDEVLMAGDALFREKVSVHFREFISNGVSMILASHNPMEILDNCSRTIWLDEGKMNFFGDTHQAVEKYYDFLAREYSEKSYVPVVQPLSNSTDHFTKIKKPLLENQFVCINQLEVTAVHKMISYEDGFQIHMSFEKKVVSKAIHLMFKIYDVYLRPTCLMISSNDIATYKQLNTLKNTKGDVDICCVFPGGILSSGIYYLEVFMSEEPQYGDKHTKEVYKLPVKLKFEVKSENFDFTGGTQNVFVKPKCNWKIQSNY